MKTKASKGNINPVDRTNKEKTIGEIELRGEAKSDASDLCNRSVEVDVEE